MRGLINRMGDNELPGGTVTFLFSDIEGSTELLQRLGDEYAELLAAHRRILRAAFEAQGGREVDTQGDAFFYSFRRASEALNAAVDAQRALAAHSWPGGAQVRVRMGLHTGEPLVAREGYVGMDVHRAARICHIGHGGQVLLSETTTALVQDALPQGVELVDLGRHLLKGLERPERICQLAVEGLPAKFPGLKSIRALPPEYAADIGPLRLPAFLKEREGAFGPHPPFVGRERELELLRKSLNTALEGGGGAVFLTGGAGQGKTALLGEFARSAMDHHSGLLVASGGCSAFTGAGDPYLPFRDVTSMLTGDLEPSLRAGLIRVAHARRIWRALPLVLRSLFDGGQDLIGVLVPARGLLSRASGDVEVGSMWLERLAALAEATESGRERVGQANISAAFLNLLDGITSERPLLLLIDDLQWADEASIDMLFHIGRHLGGRRALIVGAYRPEEIYAEGEWGQSPLGKMLSELKRLYGDVWIDLGETPETEGRRFVEVLLERELQTYSTDFRDSLFQQTNGHPLFTVELLREIRERGQLVRDDKGQWELSQDADWRVLPARVEGAIEARLGGLDRDLRDLLAVASVEGDVFTAEILARVRGIELGVLLQQLEILNERHGLVKEHGTREVAERRLFTFQFRHQLFQAHLYDHLSPARKAHLHDLIAGEMKAIFAEDPGEAAVRLAWHYEQAGMTRQAVPYMIQAADRAARLSAPKEAVKHYRQGLDLIRALPRSLARDQQELALNVGLMVSLITLRGYGHPEVGAVLERALDLGEEIGDAPQLFIPGLGYAAFLGAIAQYIRGQEAWEHLMAMAGRLGDPLFVALSHWPGWIPLMRGDFSSAFSHMGHIIQFYDLEQHSELRHTFGVDPGAISRLWAAWALWFLGCPDQAQAMAQEALELATRLDHAHSLAFVLGMGCLVHSLRGDLGRMEQWAEAALRVSREHGIEKFRGDGLINLGAARVAKGQYEDGVGKMREGIAVVLGTGTRLGYSISLLRLGWALVEAGEVGEAAQVLAQAMDFINDTGEEIMAAEALRLQGRLSSETGVTKAEIEEIYLQALAIARQQDARSLELRVLSDLCELRDENANREGALSMLRDCYRGFGEGLETRDLRRAAALLNAGQD